MAWGLGKKTLLKSTFSRTQSARPQYAAVAGDGFAPATRQKLT